MKYRWFCLYKDGLPIGEAAIMTDKEAGIVRREVPIYTGEAVELLEISAKKANSINAVFRNSGMTEKALKKALESIK